MEGFAVTCPLAPDAPRLISGSCSSPRSFGLDFLQTSPRDDALALLLAFGSAKTWLSDLHRLSNAPCPAHTSRSAARRLRRVRCNVWLGHDIGSHAATSDCRDDDLDRRGAFVYQSNKIVDHFAVHFPPEK